MHLLAQVDTVKESAARVTEWSTHLKDSVVQSVSDMASTVASFIPSLVAPWRF